MSGSVGVVDGIVGGEVCGWLANQDDDDRIEPVICRGGGRQLAFMPFTFREDVVAALGKEGVFGFAIPLGLLAPLGRKVTLSDRFGNVLAHGDALAMPPATPDEKHRPPTRIFLHIPKTAGTSLRNTLLRNVPAGEYLLVYPGRMPGLSLQRALTIPLCQRDHLSWVFGHCGFGFHRYLTRACRYITFIREPMARLRSNIHHHAAAGTPFDVQGVSVRPSAMFNEGLSDEFDNLMTRLLSGLGTHEIPLGRMGADEVEIAVHNVREHFDFVGLQAQAAVDTATLQRALGLAVAPLSADNVTPPENRYGDEELARVDWQAVAERNRADRLLYHRLQREHLVSRMFG